MPKALGRFSFLNVLSLDFFGDARPFSIRQLPVESTPSARIMETPALASFVATSNKVKSEKVKGTVTELGVILQESRTLKKAFGSEDVISRRKMLGKEPEEKEVEKRPIIIQHSGTISERPSNHMLPAQWGLVSTVFEAYNHHHELVLRPDDFWQAILTQMSFYIQARAEALRERFVDFKGKKTLVIYMMGTLFTADFGNFALAMADKIAENIKDPEMANWLLPSFTTTTANDRIAASVTMMSTLQAYFEYVCCLMCGIPKVTLLGKVEDWLQLRAKIDRLPEFDLEDKLMTKWHAMLAPVLDRLISSASGKNELDFWDRVCHHKGGGSGPSYLSGWITVFAAFSNKGEWRGDDRARTFGAEAASQAWPDIETGRVPVGAVSVPVLVDDNGTQYDTQMVAGQFGHDLCKDGSVIRPRTDWCIAFEGHPKAEPRAYRDGEVRPAAEAP
ncbi:unnamed protein product [Durusdinium trenchii]|uniref:Uncharacterized protein n=1 Tax=Durusdinium trenchii TaxID=1381693 RepID=A0ABP0MGB7_9DINO